MSGCYTNAVIDGNNNLHVLTYNRDELVYSHMFQFGTYLHGERDHADLVEMVGDPYSWDLWEENDLTECGIDPDYYTEMREVNVTDLVTAYRFAVSFDSDYHEVYGSRVFGELFSIDEYSGNVHLERLIIRSFTPDMRDEYDAAVCSGELFDDMLAEATEFLGIDPNRVEFVIEGEE